MDSDTPVAPPPVEERSLGLALAQAAVAGATGGTANAITQKLLGGKQPPPPPPPPAEK
jgi:hypothetical protein